MVTAITERETGSMAIEWPSNTFRTRWDLTWTNNDLTVKSSWVHVIGGVEGLLNAVPILRIEKTAYLAEWGNLIRMLNDVIGKYSTGVKIEFDLSVLDKMAHRISWSGHLYSC